MLKSLGAATVGVALAGCSDSGDDPADDGNGTDGDEPTATDGEEAAAVAVVRSVVAVVATPGEGDTDGRRTEGLQHRTS